MLAEGRFRHLSEVTALLGDSRYISGQHLARLRAEAAGLGLDAERVLRETDSSRTMEGLYIKVEEGGAVTERVKFVRASFLQTVEVSQTHWLERPIVPNGLNRPLSDLFLPALEARP